MDDAIIRLSPFHLIGGETGVRKLVDAFYDVMDRPGFAPELRAMHSADLGPMRDRLTDWLIGWMGGPRVYAERHPGRPCIVSAHKPFVIGARETEQWMACLRQAFKDAALSPDLQTMLDQPFAMMAEGLKSR